MMGMKKRTKRMGGGMMKKRMKAGGTAKKKFPDLSGDGKVTKKDVLMGRGVIKKKAGGKVPEGHHRTKDGGTAKKGLYYYMNRAKKAGKSKPGKGTVTDKALKASAKTAKKPVKKKKKKSS